MVTSRSRSPTVSRPRRSEPAGCDRLDHIARFRDVGAQLLRLIVGNVQAYAPRSRKVLVLLGGFQDVLFAFFAEARKVAQFAFARELRNSVNGGAL